MLIKRVNSNVFDVFWNNGWTWWARFERQPNGALKQINGKSMPTRLFQQFRNLVNRKGKPHRPYHGNKPQAAREAIQ